MGKGSGVDIVWELMMRCQKKGRRRLMSIEREDRRESRALDWQRSRVRTLELHKSIDQNCSDVPVVPTAPISRASQIYSETRGCNNLAVVAFHVYGPEHFSQAHRIIGER